MSLPSLCIKRPVFTTMLIALPVVLGLMALNGIGVDLFPNVEFPVVIVTTARPGASVEEMETGVTKVVEEAVNTISGIDELKSTTVEGVAVVTVQFVLSKDRDVAQQEVQGKINTILSKLPTGTDTPIVDKFDVDAAPVILVTVSGQRSLRELTELADRQIKDSLAGLDGVGAITRIGGRKRAINVTIDARKLEAYGLSIEQVRQALASQNLELPGGRVEQERREMVLRTMGRIEQPEQFADIIVASKGGQPVRIRDLGDSEVASTKLPGASKGSNSTGNWQLTTGNSAVEDGFEQPRSLARLNGENVVFLIVQKQSGSNTVQVIDHVKRRLKVLEQTFAQEGKSDVRLGTARDQSRFIKASMHEVQKHLVLGACLVVLTILLFLRDWRTMVIAGVAIPVSLISTFPVMRALNLTLNNMTLIALTLVIGIVIDDAVIVIENVFRWMEEQHVPPMVAALKGTQEITLAVVATTMSLVVIFLPIAFMSGMVGRFLSSFGVTCAIAILTSLLVSLTLTPMLSSRFLKISKKARKKEASGVSHHSGGIYGWIVEKPYLFTLRWAMRHRWAIVLATLIVTASLFPIRPLKYPGLVGMVGYDFMPKDDQSEFIINVIAPEGWSLEQTSDVFAQIEKRMGAWPEVTSVLAYIGDGSGRAGKGQGTVAKGVILASLPEIEDRKAPAGGGGAFTQFEIMARARALLKDYPDLRTSVQLPAAISSGSANADVEFQLTGPDLARLNDYADRMIAKLRQVRGLVDVDTTLTSRTPEVRVLVDRDRAADLGVGVQSIASTLGVLVGGQIVTDYKDHQLGEIYDVWLRARGIDRDDSAAVAELALPSNKGAAVRLGNVARVVEDVGPSQIDRSQRQRKISIIGNIAGIPMTSAAQAFRDAFAELNAPPEYALTTTGRAKAQAESVVAFFMAFGLSLILMYMILAAQFESFVHPITILLAVPLTVPFAILSLIFLHQPLTLFSVLGLFLLFGIVKKNGILQVDYTNVLRRQAAEDPESVHQLFRQTEEELTGKRPGGWQRWMMNLPADKRVRLWAILEANRVRLRPILMTTLMLVTAMIPIALGKGPGAANRADMAKVIVGGQALSLLLSLLVTPVTYSLFDDLGRRFRRRGPVAAEPVETRREFEAVHN